MSVDMKRSAVAELVGKRDELLNAGVWLRDCSALVKVGLKGRGVLGWLSAHGFMCAEDVYGIEREAASGGGRVGSSGESEEGNMWGELGGVGGAGGVLVRVGGDEVIAESGAGDDALVGRLEKALAVDGHEAEKMMEVYRVEQAGCTFLLGGERVGRVWAQTCGVNVIEEPVDRIFYTRVAGMSCGIIPEMQDGARVYRIWTDYSFGPALWETLAGIGRELG